MVLYISNWVFILFKGLLCEEQHNQHGDAN